MNIEPSYALQAAVYSALTTSTDVITAFGGTPRVYDRVPQNPQYPFIHIGDDQIIGGTSYVNRSTSEAHCSVHIFSQAAGKPEAKIIVGAVFLALNNAITIASPFRIMDFNYEQTRAMTDPDGLTEHLIFEITYYIAAN